MESRTWQSAFVRGMILAGALAGLAGCAHGWNGEAGTRDVRGSTKVDGRARLLVAGPVLSVHADVDGGGPVGLYLVDRVNGDDGDCARRPGTGAVALAPRAGRHVEVGPGREICAMAAPAGVREVLWHARLAGPETVVAKK
jgi:hypothetical protein